MKDLMVHAYVYREHSDTAFSAHTDKAYWVSKQQIIGLCCM